MAAADNEMLAAIAPVVAAFESLGVEYCLGGSLASSLFGEPRSTRDADLVARLSPTDAVALSQLVAGKFYLDLGSMLSAVNNGSSFNLIHLETMVKVDIFVRNNDAFTNSRLNRRISRGLGADPVLQIWVSSAEDILMAKLEWFRDGGCASERQWRDILGIIKIQGSALDINYLKTWADNIGVSGLLAKAMSEASAELGL